MRIPNITETKYQDCRIGATIFIKPEQVHNLIRLTVQHTSEHSVPLGGRSPVIKTRLVGIGPVVVKKYLRGGMMQFFFKDRYLKTGPCRARSEFEILLKAAELGINVPCPTAYLQKGNLLYQCWLVTKEIPNNGTIAQISMTDPGSAKALMNDVALQVQKMTKKGVYHVDFHPGNILAGKDGKVYLLDFDKAVITKMSAAALSKKYIERWNRAVLKHHLPKLLLKDSFF